MDNTNTGQSEEERKKTAIGDILKIVHGRNKLRIQEKGNSNRNS
jgi:hypothetical protein